MCAAVLSICALAAAGCNQPRFDYEYNFGVRVAQSRNKPLLLYFADFTTTAHRELINKVFPHPQVRAEMTQCENVALTWQWGPAPRKYGIRSAQWFVMCKPDGTEVDRLDVGGIPTPPDFARWLRETRSRAIGVPATSQPARR